MEINFTKKLTKSFAKAFAPATVANVGPGFDMMGFAIHGIGDVVEVEPNGLTYSQFINIIGNTSISHELNSNTAGMSIKSFLEENAPGEGVNITLYKNMPIGSGMGSSAASAAAGVAAVNALLQNPLPTEELIKYALDGEAVASKSRHGDNVIPSLMGGFIVISDIEKFTFFKIKSPDELHILLIHPHTEINTSFARTILSPQIERKDSIKQTSAAVTLVAGLLTSDFNLISSASRDYIAEPKRGKLIPEYENAKKLALENGAYAFNISGSGPTSFAIFSDEASARRVIALLEKLYLNNNITVDFTVSRVNNEGAKVLEVR
jgi:homoserine kinase